MRNSMGGRGDSGAARRAMMLGGVCLAVGMGLGWLIRGMDLKPSGAQTPPQTSAATVPSPGANTDPAQLKAQADMQAAPLLQQLQVKPEDAGLLASIGNVYYDAQQYATAVGYYGRSLKTNPADPMVRTDMGTAYWYQGDADHAIAAFEQALEYAPNNPNTLFNLGLVKWQGKGDSAGAVGAWQKLLSTNPTYSARDKVQQLLAEVQKQGGAAGAGR